ncbi:hypothetical protein IVB45_18515 [Bradyrhizobium sp. 4]|uniref:hypothetical protein n=1 Tax=unclassified Bradyrhizobium TaxID=2631580 RepID=UPI001FFBB444|nr:MULTISPECIES: hypothetical protein [unclassified Bradyrhizobium]MCK1400116.1 hypothetical protein [Bradyrhizobium sp. 39]MCK1750406.1 hypothetical protein [Bradyrhizobium sp. 135]UPJ32015.1 hypothetical protein IVB45_18515 [Bradyrhizobium sp. 4]
MSAKTPDLGEMALRLEHELVRRVSAGPVDKRFGAEIAQMLVDAKDMELAGLLACGRALHAAAAVCFARNDKDAELLHDMAQRLIGMAYDRVALSTPPEPDGATMH